VKGRNPLLTLSALSIVVSALGYLLAYVGWRAFGTIFLLAIGFILVVWAIAYLADLKA
jgi:energy-converting hydrogenase Eha subunit C